MFYLIKDMFNPINWIKLIKDPKKIFTILDRIFYYPSLRFGYSKSKIYKNFIIKFTIFLAKRNKKFKEIFFSEMSVLNSKEIFIDFKNQKFDEKNFQILKDNGIIVLENILSHEEHKNIKFNFENNLELNKFEKIKNIKSNEIVMKKINNIFDKNLTLDNISNFFTKKIYGKNILPKQHYLNAAAIKLPEKMSPGDNIFHVDRFLPNLKMIYFPYKVDENNSPFSFALGSHKINSEYLDFFINNETWIFDERNPSSEKFLKYKKEIHVNENSLVVALTNGFHSRTPFRKYLDRSAIFFTYPNFNLISLMFPKN